jgi:hypothetical protein
LAAPLTHRSKVTDSHFAAHTDPVVAFTNDATTAAHSYLHPNAPALAYQHNNPDRYRCTDHRTDRYVHSNGHSVSHRHAHSYRHHPPHRHAHGDRYGHPHAFTHLHGLAHCHTYRHSHGYGYSHAYRNHLAN